MNTNTKPMTRKQAEQAGYTVDTHCSPWLGYKGPRFAPTERVDVLTDLEAELLEALKLAERNCSSRLCMLPVKSDERELLTTELRIYQAAIAKAEGR